MKHILRALVVAAVVLFAAERSKAVPVAYTITYTGPGPSNNPFTTSFTYDPAVNTFVSFAVRWQSGGGLHYFNFLQPNFTGPPDNGFLGQNHGAILANLLGGGGWGVYIAYGGDALFTLGGYSTWSVGGGCANYPVCGESASGTFATTQVPETGATVLLLIVGVAGLFLVRRGLNRA